MIQECILVLLDDRMFTWKNAYELIYKNHHRKKDRKITVLAVKDSHITDIAISILKRHKINVRFIGHKQKKRG